MIKDFFCDLTWCRDYNMKNLHNCSNHRLAECPYKKLFEDHEKLKQNNYLIFRDRDSDEENDIWEKL